MSSKKPSLQPLKGTRDFYPKQQERMRAITGTFERVLRRYGYREWEAPLVENLGLFASKASTEILEEQSYLFQDRGGRDLILRPEVTPQVARLVAAKQRELPRVLRWFNTASCWRYEKPQKGRLRNFFQLNVDLVGSSDPSADVEIIETPLQILKELGADMTKIRVAISDRMLLENTYIEAKITDVEVCKTITSLIDRRAKMESDIWDERMIAAGINNEQLKEIKRFLALDAGSIPDAPIYDRLRAIISELTEKGLGDTISFDPTIVRGFDYYTSMVFEVYDTTGGFRRSVFGGGRYDNLIGDMGGTATPTVGCAASIVAIESMFEAQGTEMTLNYPKRFMIIPFDESLMKETRTILETLRDADLSVSNALAPYDISKQLKLADKLEISSVILVNPDEFENDEVVVKNLKTGKQENVKIDELASFLKEK